MTRTTTDLAALDSLWAPWADLFSTTVLYALACGVAGLGGGLALFLVAVRGLPAKPDHEKQKASERAGELIRFAGRRGSLAALVRPRRAADDPLGGRGHRLRRARLLLGPPLRRRLRGAGRHAARGGARLLDGVVARHHFAGAVGLEQAIPASARAAAPVLRPHLDALVDRLRARTPLPEALQQLADEIDDASADIIVAALILNARLRGPGLRQVLGALAKSAREEVDMRQRVMAQRASTRRSVQIVVAVSIAFVLGLSIFNRDFVEPYGTAVGQVVLACVRGLFALGFWWLRKLSTIETPERFLVRDDSSVRLVRPRTPGAGPAQASPFQPEEGVRR
ncbi:Type II secretion system protein OS=Streptomyces tendae OX=1932 GN=F3L20_02725 PE=4 SV=1 [Streptomyces tendae]